MYEIVTRRLGAVEAVRIVVLYASDVYLDLKTDVPEVRCNGPSYVMATSFNKSANLNSVSSQRR